MTASPTGLRRLAVMVCVFWLCHAKRGIRPNRLFVFEPVVFANFLYKLTLGLCVNMRSVQYVEAMWRLYIGGGHFSGCLWPQFSLDVGDVQRSIGVLGLP